MKNRRQFVFFTITTSYKLEIHVSVRLPTMKISQRARENFYSYCKTLLSK